MAAAEALAQRLNRGGKSGKARVTRRRNTSPKGAASPGLAPSPGDVFVSEEARAQLQALVDAGETWGWEFRAPLGAIAPERNSPPDPGGPNYAERYAAWRELVISQEVSRAQVGATQPLWWPITPQSDSSMVMCFGGTTVSWRCLLTTVGVSAAGAGQQVTLINLSDRTADDSLISACHVLGIDARDERLSSKRSTFDFSEGVSGDELLAYVLDVLTAGDRNSRERAEGKAALRQVFRCLDEPVTLPKLHAALQVSLREQLRPDSSLSGNEISRVMELFGEEMRSHGGLTGKLAVLAEQIEDLARFLPPAPGADILRHRPLVMSIAVDRSMGQMDFDLAVDLLTEHVLRDGREDRRSRLTVVLGAERMRTRVVETLAAASVGSAGRTLLCFPNLRDEAEEVLGSEGASTIFMRMPNSKDATKAAEYIGKDYRFVLSEVTVTRGETLEQSEGASSSVERGRSTQSSLSLFGGGGSSVGESTGTTAGTSRNAGRQISSTTAEGRQRVHEFAVEPEELQRLAPTGYLMVEFVDGKRVVQTADVDPQRAADPRVARPGEAFKAL